MMDIFQISISTVLITLYSCNQAPDFGGMPQDTTLEPISKSEEEIPKEKSFVDRKVIKEGDISFETGDAKETCAMITKNI